MQYHQTDDQGFYVGTFDADASPAEPDIYDEGGALIQEGVWLIPRGGVVEPVPALGVEECARWTGAAWEVLPDLRGREYWTADHKRHVIEARGVALPAGALDADPPKTQAEIDADESAKAKAELMALDLASIRDLRAYVAAQPDAPQTLKDREAAAVIARGKVKP